MGGGEEQKAWEGGVREEKGTWEGGGGLRGRKGGHGEKERIRNGRELGTVEMRLWRRLGLMRTRRKGKISDERL